ncbi:F-box domain-containing protein [Mycena chlorophos]|uniref:F-box domain-containing protein n=1 Tax=Mycena chlorophos TaxID=658473 RepID=A0A8H6VZV7_MYCCL|nr:F-box domain-containing protein [Mycena chlorophos]
MNRATQALRDQISDLKADLARQIAAVSASEDALRVLELRLEETSTFPVDTLPAELLAEIFLHVLPTKMTIDDLHLGLRWGPVPLILSQICRRWREVALGVPRLWVDVALCIVDNCGQRNHNALSRAAVSAQRLELHATRAGGRLLRLALGCSKPHLWSDGEPNVDVIPFMEILRRYSTQVEEISLELGRREMEQLRQAAFELNFLNLRSVSLSLDTSWLGDGRFGMFSDAPALRAVDLGAVNPQCLDLPWEQVTELVAESCTPDVCCTALRRASNLRRAEFSMIPIARNPEPRRIVHPVLSELFIRECREYEAHILNYFELPALQSLTLLTTESDDNFFASFSDFLDQSGSQLRTLVLGRPWMGVSMSPLRGLDLTRLEIREVPHDFAMELFGSLKHLDNAFLPNLDELEIRLRLHRDRKVIDSVVYRVGDAILRRNQRSRDGEGTHCPVHTLRVSFAREDAPYWLPEDAFRDYRTLRQDGVHVYVGAGGRIIV